MLLRPPRRRAPPSPTLFPGMLASKTEIALAVTGKMAATTSAGYGCIIETKVAMAKRVKDDMMCLSVSEILSDEEVGF